MSKKPTNWERIVKKIESLEINKKQIIVIVLIVLANYCSFQGFKKNDEKYFGTGVLFGLLAVFVAFQNDENSQSRNQRKIELQNRITKAKIEKMLSEMPIPESLEIEDSIEKFRNKLIERYEKGEFSTQKDDKK